MLFDLFTGRYNATDAVIVFVIMVFALIFHNVFQSWLASRFGDNSPRFSGFMQFDPQHQLEVYGVAFLALLGFGWPKAIPTSHRNYKGNQEALVWYAGPLAYLIIAFVCLLIAAVFEATSSSVLARSFFLAASVATLHAVINLFPVYPLDGAKAALIWGNTEVRRVIQQIASYGLLGFIVVFFLLSYTGITTGIINFFMRLFLTIISFIPGI